LNSELLKRAYKKDDEGEYVFSDDANVLYGDLKALIAMLRLMVLHGGPPDTLVADLAPPFQQIVHDDAQLRVRLPAYLTQRRAIVDANCPLLPPLQDLMHGYELPTTTDELWATGLGALLPRAKRSRPERCLAPARRSARLHQKCQ
jgi:hypothetical protein